MHQPALYDLVQCDISNATKHAKTPVTLRTPTMFAHAIAPTLRAVTPYPAAIVMVD